MQICNNFEEGKRNTRVALLRKKKGSRVVIVCKVATKARFQLAAKPKTSVTVFATQTSANISFLVFWLKNIIKKKALSTVNLLYNTKQNSQDKQ